MALLASFAVTPAAVTTLANLNITAQAGIVSNKGRVQ
jgi:hypothetical protein